MLISFFRQSQNLLHAPKHEVRTAYQEDSFSSRRDKTDCLISIEIKNADGIDSTQIDATVNGMTFSNNNWFGDSL